MTAFPPPQPQDRAGDATPPVARTGWRGLFCMLLALAAACGWGLVVRHRFEPHPQVIPAGQAWQQPSGASVRLVGWTRQATLKDAVGNPVAPPAGSTWVMGTVAFEHPSLGMQCELVLRGSGDHQWLPSTVDGDTANPHYCQGGETGRVDVVAAVPNRYLDDVRGVGFRTSNTWTQAPLLAHP